MSESGARPVSSPTPAHAPEGTGLAPVAVGSPLDLSRLFRLDGKTAVVVGGGSGIGQAVTLGLAAHGAHVVCADRDGSAAEVTAAQAGGLDGAVAAYQVDILDEAAVTRFVADHADADILVVTPAVNVRKRLLDYSSDEFDRVVSLNLRAAFELTRGFGREMAARGRGSIIGFSSIRSLTTEPGQGVYAMTKAGLVMLLRTLAVELGPHGVRANAVAPGVIDTPLTAPIKNTPDWYAAYAAKSIAGRWGRPEELVGACVYLASDAASYVTGTVLFVDGGWTAADGRFTPPS